MYKEVTKNPEIVPLLKKSDTSEELHLRLAHFYGLSDLSAATLLPESYRNALAICIYLAAVLQSSSTARFVVLDDVTSSFDAGHQWSLMELIRTKIAYPANPSGPQVIIPLGSNGCRGCSLKQALTVTRENPPFKCGMTSSQTKTIALNRFERARKFIIASLRMATPDGSSRVHSGGMCTKTLFVPNVTKFPLIALPHCTRTKRTIGNTFPDQLAKDFAPHIAALCFQCQEAFHGPNLVGPSISRKFSGTDRSGNGTLYSMTSVRLCRVLAGTCPVTRVVSMGRRNTHSKRTCRSLRR